MGIISKEQLLSVDDLLIEEVDVPEWGGTIRVRALSGTERDAFESSCVKNNRKGNTSVDLENIRARLCALAIVDEKGHRMFNADEAKELGKKSAVALQRIFEVATRLSGITEEAIEELEGN